MLFLGPITTKVGDMPSRRAPTSLLQLADSYNFHHGPCGCEPARPSGATDVTDDDLLIGFVVVDCQDAERLTFALRPDSRSL
jgi:hypothetical protein